MAELNVTAQLDMVIAEFDVQLKRATNNSLDVVGKQAVKKLKATSPRHTPHLRKYAEGWALKRSRGKNGINEVIAYNKTNPSLTHLLENGHDVVNWKGTVGRAPAVKHIAPVEEWVQEELPREIEKEYKP